jgi:hypothetical protein
MRSFKIPLLTGLILVCATPSASVFALAEAKAAPPTEEALRIYADLTGRTVLRPGPLPQLPDSFISELTAESANRTNAVALIEGELNKVDVEVIRDGNLFVWVLPAGWSNSPVASALRRVPRPPPSSSPPAGSRELVPAGMIDFRNTLLDQVLAVYSDFRSRTILRSAALPHSVIRCRTQSSLTRDEVVYALNVLLILNGVEAVDDGEKFVQIVPFRQVSRIQLKAPTADSGAAVVDPEKIPVFGFVVRRPEPLTTRAPFVDNLVAFYAELTERKALPSDQFGKLPITFRINNLLTKPELLYAIETTMALNGLAIVSVGEDSVCAERLPEPESH